MKTAPWSPKNLSVTQHVNITLHSGLALTHDGGFTETVSADWKQKIPLDKFLESGFFQLQNEQNEQNQEKKHHPHPEYQENWKKKKSSITNFLFLSKTHHDAHHLLCNNCTPLGGISKFVKKKKRIEAVKFTRGKNPNPKLWKQMKIFHESSNQMEESHHGDTENSGSAATQLTNTQVLLHSEWSVWCL